MSSIRDSFLRRQTLIQEADKLWDELAQQMSARIPESMAVFAKEMGWIKGELDNWWKLPEWLDYLCTNTQRGACNDCKFRRNDLGGYGFSSFQVFESALQDLERAWEGLVRIEIDKGEDYRWTVRFYATEIIPPRF